eukprot:6200647-Pleurochrysis_carterae.AAC.3
MPPAVVSRCSTPSTSPSMSRPRMHPEIVHSWSVGSMLGSGAFGSVWMATHRVNGMRAAIKVVDKQRQLCEDFSLDLASLQPMRPPFSDCAHALSLTCNLPCYMVVFIKGESHPYTRLHVFGRVTLVHEY